MPLAAMGLAFASAILHAVWNVMLKRSRDLDAASAGVLAVAMVLSATGGLLVPGRAFPTPPTLLFGLAAGIFEGCYFFGLARALERSPLGWSYSWMRGSAIVMVWPFSVLAMGEAFSWLALACVCCVCSGLALLGQRVERKPVRRALAWVLFTGFCIAVCNLLYKAALDRHAEPLALFGLSMAVGLPIQAAFRIRRGGWAAFRFLPAEPWRILGAGVLCALGFVVFLLALAMSGAGAVTTIRNTSVAFTMVFSLVLGERPRPRQWAGALLVTLGAVGLGWL